ncbi:MAG: hypothetical protein WD063_10530 [Pirellulales bacterium]
MKKIHLAAAVLGSWAFAWAAIAAAQEADAPPADVPGREAPDGAADGGLATEQQQVADRFRELERLLLRMAELTAPTDPRRAALLKRAVAQSKDRAIDQRFDELVKLLRDERLAAVVTNQGEVHNDLVKLLELLLSEDRSKRIETEKERVRDYLKRVNKIIKEQKAVQGETERRGDAGKLADQQSELAGKTGELAKDIDASGQKKPDEKSQDAKTPDEETPDKDSQQPDKGDQKDKPKGGDSKGQKPDKSKDGQQQDKDAESKDAKPGESQGEKKDQPPGEKAPPVEPPGQEGSQGQGQQRDQSPQQSAQERLEQAQKRMQEAQKKLEEAKRTDAVEKQAEALRELEKAKAELEEILRQLREEEMARTLAMLESRFRKMLEAQIEVYEGTRRLDKVPAAERDRDDEIESDRMSRKEAQIAVEADKALDVLREEGSAVAFPEAVTEMRDDMVAVRDLLAEAKVGAITQGIEQDIIAALEEMIAALEKAQKDMEKQNQQQPMQGDGDSEMPLVDTLSELKMIRALQMRVNTRTKRYGEMVKAEQADQPELLEALRRLAEREQRIHKVTRDIVVGRNR